MKNLQSKPALILIFCFFISLLINQSSQAENDLCQNCSIAEYKRCYNDNECKCLKGLYQKGDKCLGVVRYDMNLTLFVPSTYKSYQTFSEEIIELFKNIPANSKDSLVNPNYEMDIEDWIVERVESKAQTRFFGKLVYWKKEQKNPQDLPALSLEQMKNVLNNYFEANKREGSDTKYIVDLNIGDTSIAEFQKSFYLAYNQLTCKTDKYNYCYEHNWCTPNLGAVKCECEQKTSVDVSPQKDLFPGEKCELGCSKTCQNEGICRLKDKEFVCYCLGWYVGEYCQISIIWFIIVAASLIIIFFILSILCGVFEGLDKRNRKKEALKQQEKMEKVKEKRF